MNDRQLYTFIGVAEAQSFYKAEQTLYLSRQAIKKQIDALEKDLDLVLLVRTSHGVCLTPCGEEFYRGIKEVMASGEALIGKCRDISQHEHIIRIGNPKQPRLVLEKAFLEFANQYPYIKQDIQFINETKSVQLVLDGTLDVAEYIFPTNADKSRVGYVKLCDMPYKCLVAAGHPLARRSAIHLEDLSGNEISLRQSGNTLLIQKLRETCRDITLVETGHDEAQHIFATCYNQGVFISRAYYASDMQPLTTVPLECGISGECCLIYKKRHSPVVGKFINVVKSCYSAD